MEVYLVEHASFDGKDLICPPTNDVKKAEKIAKDYVQADKKKYRKIKPSQKECGIQGVICGETIMEWEHGEEEHWTAMESVTIRRFKVLEKDDSWEPKAHF